MKTTYEFNEKDSLPERAAHCLDWYRKTNPNGFLPYNLLTKMVMGYARMPNLKSTEVEQMRRRMKQVKPILMKKYNCELVSVPGAGVRATVNDLDKLQKIVPQKEMRLRKAADSLATTVMSIDRNKLPAAFRGHFDAHTKALVDKVMAPGFLKLVSESPLPAPPSADDKKGENAA